MEIRILKKEAIPVAARQKEFQDGAQAQSRPSI